MRHITAQEKDPFPVCADGFDLHLDGYDWDAQCFRVLKEEPEYECPYGFDLKKGKCIK